MHVVKRGEGPGAAPRLGRGGGLSPFPGGPRLLPRSGGAPRAAGRGAGEPPPGWGLPAPHGAGGAGGDLRGARPQLGAGDPQLGAPALWGGPEKRGLVPAEGGAGGGVSWCGVSLRGCEPPAPPSCLCSQRGAQRPPRAEGSREGGSWPAFPLGPNREPGWVVRSGSHLEGTPGGLAPPVGGPVLNPCPPGSGV